jgi:hypothetical protein
MGLDIVFVNKDGTTFNVHMCYSSFGDRVMSLDDMINWGFTDDSGRYSGKQLEFLINRLVKSEYLEKRPNPMPIKAVFC